MILLSAPNKGRSDIQSLETDWKNFDFGFWHPFGQHGRESPSDIIHRKRNETEKNGWTLWSFQCRTPQALDQWCSELSSARLRGPVVVFCSRGRSAVDPDRPGARAKTSDCRQYKFVGQDDWHPVPSLIRVPHPFNPGKTLATAFVVRRVHHPIKLLDGPSVEWFSKGKWREDEIPTRPEYLIRRGGKIGMREVSAVPELTPPYLAIVRL